jgi:hypothetical protein
VRTGFVWTVACCYEHGNITLCLFEGGEFSDQRGEKFAPRTYLFFPEIFIYIPHVFSAANLCDFVECVVHSPHKNKC